MYKKIHKKSFAKTCKISLADPLAQNYGNNILRSNLSVPSDDKSKDIPIVTLKLTENDTKLTTEIYLIPTFIPTEVHKNDTTQSDQNNNSTEIIQMRTQKITIEREYQDNIKSFENCSVIDAINDTAQCKCKNLDKGGTFILAQNSTTAKCVGQEKLRLVLGIKPMFLYATMLGSIFLIYCFFLI